MGFMSTDFGMLTLHAVGQRGPREHPGGEWVRALILWGLQGHSATVTKHEFWLYLIAASIAKIVICNFKRCIYVSKLIDNQMVLVAVTMLCECDAMTLGRQQSSDSSWLHGVQGANMLIDVCTVSHECQRCLKVGDWGLGAARLRTFFWGATFFQGPCWGGRTGGKQEGC